MRIDLVALAGRDVRAPRIAGGVGPFAVRLLPRVHESHEPAVLAEVAGGLQLLDQGFGVAGLVGQAARIPVGLEFEAEQLHVLLRMLLLAGDALDVVPHAVTLQAAIGLDERPTLLRLESRPELLAQLRAQRRRQLRVFDISTEPAVVVVADGALAAIERRRGRLRRVGRRRGIRWRALPSDVLLGCVSRRRHFRFPCGDEVAEALKP